MRVGVTDKRFVKMNIRAGGGNATTQRGKTDRATERTQKGYILTSKARACDHTSRDYERYAPAGLPRKASHHASPQAAAGQVPVGEWHDARAIALCTSLAILS